MIFKDQIQYERIRSKKPLSQPRFFERKGPDTEREIIFFVVVGCYSLTAEH